MIPMGKVYDPSAFDSAVAQKKEDLAQTATEGAKSFTSGLTELVTMQEAEIQRLRSIITDNTTIPERFAEHVAISVSHEPSGHGGSARQRNTLFVTANDRSMWLCRDFYAGGKNVEWFRVPSLPQASDEMGTK